MKWRDTRVITQVLERIANDSLHRPLCFQRNCQSRSCSQLHTRGCYRSDEASTSLWTVRSGRRRSRCTTPERCRSRSRTLYRELGTVQNSPAHATYPADRRGTTGARPQSSWSVPLRRPGHDRSTLLWISRCVTAGFRNYLTLRTHQRPDAQQPKKIRINLVGTKLKKSGLIAIY